MPVFVLQWLPLDWKIDHVFVSVSIDFPVNSKQDACFIVWLMIIFLLIGMVFAIIWKMFQGRIFLNSVLLLLLVNLWVVQFGIDVYIPHHKYQVKHHSSPWCSAGFAAAIIYRNHFFHLYQQNKSSESEVKFRQASNHCKRVLEATKLAYATKTKESFTSQKIGSRYFWRIANSVLNKSKSAIPPLFNRPEVLSSASDKANYFLKKLLRNLILMTLVSLYLFSLLELIWNCIIFP